MRVRDYMGTEVVGRCMRCKTNRTFLVTTHTRTKDKSVALKGVCPEPGCGATISRLVGVIED